MSPENSCSLKEWKDPNIGISNVWMSRRTYNLAFTTLPFFFFHYKLSEITDLSIIFSLKKSLSFTIPQSETAFSKVTSDFLITRYKAIFYYLPLCYVTRISLSLELFPCRFVLLHFWLCILCSLWWLFFMLSYHREPGDLVFWPSFLLSLLSFIVFPFNWAPFKLLCVCQRWHHFFTSLRPKSFTLSLTLLSPPNPASPHILSLISSK